MIQKAIQKINILLEILVVQPRGARLLFIMEVVKETVLCFLKGIVKLL